MIGEYSASGTLLRRYVHGPGIDNPLVWYEGGGTVDRCYLHNDERGSLIAVSDASGAMLAINSYDEYGIPGTGGLGRFRYTGQTWLPELGFYFAVGGLFFLLVYKEAAVGLRILLDFSPHSASPN